MAAGAAHYRRHNREPLRTAAENLHQLSLGMALIYSNTDDFRQITLNSLNEPGLSAIDAMGRD